MKSGALGKGRDRKYSVVEIRARKLVASKQLPESEGPSFPHLLFATESFNGLFEPLHVISPTLAATARSEGILASFVFDFLLLCGVGGKRLIRELIFLLRNRVGSGRRLPVDKVGRNFPPCRH